MRNSSLAIGWSRIINSIFLISFSFSLIVAAVKVEAALSRNEVEQGLQKIVEESDGRLGICALEVTMTKPVCINGEQKFSLQSVMKLIAAAAVMDAIDRRQMQLDEVVVVKPENASPGPQEFADLVRSKGSLKVTIGELIQHAVIDSDSTSVDFLIERLGGVSNVQDFLRRKRIEGIRIDRDERHLQAESMGLTWRADLADSKKFEAAVNALSVKKRDAAWIAYLRDFRDTATPIGMVSFLKALAEGKLLSQESTHYLLRVMEKVRTGPDRLMAGIPRNWSIGHKTGTSPSWKGMVAATNDVGLLTAPHGGRIAVAVFVAESKRSNSERAGVIVKTARIVTGAYK